MGLSHSSRVSSQACITLDHVECFADPSWASAARATVPSHQGHFCSGPHLACQPTQTHTWGLIRMGNRGQSPPRRRAPWPGSHGPLCTQGWHMLLAGRQGPSEPLMHKALCYKDTLPSVLVYGDPQPRGHCAHCEAHQQGRLLPTPCLTVHQPAQTQPPPATPPPYLST